MMSGYGMLVLIQKALPKEFNGSRIIIYGMMLIALILPRRIYTLEEMTIIIHHAIAI